MIKNRIFCFIIFIVGINCHAKNYYVSPFGNANNDGLKVKSALNTIQSAVNKMQPGDTCFVLEGVYREKVTFPASGTAEKPIVVTAYKNQKVTLTGLEVVNGWKKTSNGRWQTSVDWSLGKGKNQLFYKGEVMLEARFPNIPVDSLKLPVEGLNKLQPTFETFSNIDPDHLVSASIKKFDKNTWKGAIYYGVHNDGWSAQTAIIESSSADTLIIEDKTKQWWFFPRPFYLKYEFGRGMLIGCEAALDIPSEWLLNDNQTLTFISPDGKTPNNVTELKKRQIGLDFSNQSYINVIGIDVKAASVLMINSNYCTINHSKMQYISHYTIVNDGGSKTDKDKNGESGICISGSHNSILNSSIEYSAGSGIILYGNSHVIHNNLINEVDYCATYCAGINIKYINELYNGNHIISYNSISNTGRHALSFSGGMLPKNAKPIPFAASLITHNHILDGLLQTRDAGLVSSFNTNAGAFNDKQTEFSYNVIHDCHDLVVLKENWKLGLVYLDNNTWNINNHHNLLWAKPGTVQIPYLFNAPDVNITWGKSRFMKAYTGSISSLKDSDFPDSTRFDFGYNPNKSPALPSWINNVTDQFPIHQNWTNGSEFKHEKVNFSNGFKSIILKFSCDDTTLNIHSFNVLATGTTLKKQNKGFLLFNLGNDKVNLKRSAGILDRHGRIKNLTDNSYICFKELDSSEGYRQIRFSFASQNKQNKWIEIRLDSLTAPIFQTIPLPFSESKVASDADHLSPFIEMKAALAEPLKGLHDVYFVFKGGDGKEIGQIFSMYFEKYAKQVELGKDEAVIEIRLDSPDGELLGMTYPVSVGSGLNENCIDLENKTIQGEHSLYFVYRSTNQSKVFVESVRLEK
jgi:hypothetical protein